MSEHTHVTNVEADNKQGVRVQSRADDTVVDKGNILPPTITLYTIDEAILKYLQQRIKPIVTQNGTNIVVPIIYGDPERWKSAQRDGVLRDSMGKIQLPMMMLRRSIMEKMTSINSPINNYYERTFSTGWNRRVPYDRFSVINGIHPAKVYYDTTAAPDYYKLTYKCVIWTEYMEQMNKIIENVSFESDDFWGEANNYKFRAIIKSFSHVTEVPTSADRVIKTNFDLIVYAYLLPESLLDAGNHRGPLIRPRYAVKKVVTFTEIE